ncbi:LysM peptidoglycan-binding domain-containing protein [Candidatus Gottesmanbacteria bacterium]|nr:LysM peptidoglycan-binding domain-containing protein [Candidatus Gottesmanbacteria bacterium]
MWKSIKDRFNSTDSYVSLVLGLAVVLVIGVTIVNYVRGKGSPASSTTTKEEKSKEMPKLPAQHTIKAGETLWSIAEDYYKSGYNWVDIDKANSLPNANFIEEGQVLTIPDVTPIPTGAISAASTEGKPKQKEYTVVHGDNLWNIAQAMYDNGYKWVEIAKANKLENPDLIHAGNVLTLPE